MPVSLNKINEQEYSVTFGRRDVGIIKISTNKFHAGNGYVQLNLKDYDTYYARELFEQLADEVCRPMQVMLSSTEQEKINFLETAGFRCARKCYEMEVSEKDLVTETIQEETTNSQNGAIGFQNGTIDSQGEEIGYCTKGSLTYDLCCQLMFEYYSKVHKHINPLTAEYAEFVEILPAEAMYQMKDGGIFGVAFLEENEIAYVGARGADGFSDFLKKVIQKLFEQYDSITFECDDCDPAAMELRGLFKSGNDESYDTYIRKYVEVMPDFDIRDEISRRRI